MFYLATGSISLLEADWLKLFMCINISVLFGIIGVVRMWCDIMIIAAGFVNNDSRCESSMAEFQDMTVGHGM